MVRSSSCKKSLYENLSTFFGDISVMIGSAMPMSDIVASLAGDESGSFGASLSAMVPLIEDGASLSEAMKAEGSFPDYAVRLTASGEQSGKLEETAEALSLYYDHMEQQRSLVESAMVQPLILLSLLAVITAAFICIVLPVISGVYRSLGGIGGFWMTAGYAAAAIAFVLLACAMVFLLSVKNRLRTRSVEEIPVLRRFRATESIVEKTVLSSFAADLSTRVSGGLFADRAFASAAEALKPCELKDKLTACSEAVADGGSLCSVLSGSGILPPSCMHVINSGVRNGRVEQALSRAAEMLASDLRAETENLVRRIEPALTGFFTVMVGISLFSVMLPLIGAITSIG